MKYQKLVSSTTPFALQEWLGQELEVRGIDNVYARSILSLLQQEYVDVEPNECQHIRNKQLKVLQKYGGPENLISVTKSKHQKWKTWGKQILLNSTSCCKAGSCDLERIKKKAAVDCLRSASEYHIYDIEDLIDEVWIKLKNNKNLKGEIEERSLRSIKSLQLVDSFYIPPSSPTDEIEKYFAAFPPLKSSTEIKQKRFFKNVWCEKCDIKNSKIQSGEMLHSDNSNKYLKIRGIQPIIPLKAIKSIYKKEEKDIFKANNVKKSLTVTKFSISQKYSNKAQTIFAQQHKFSEKCVVIENNLFYCRPKHVLPFENLTSLRIKNISLSKIQLLDILKQLHIPNFPSVSNDAESCIFQKLQLGSDTLNIGYMMPQKESINSFICQEEFLSEKNFISNVRCYSNLSLHAPIQEASNIENVDKSTPHNIDLHFRMPPLSDLLDYTENPFLELIESPISPLGHSHKQTGRFFLQNNINYPNDVDLFKGSNHTSTHSENKSTNELFNDSIPPIVGYNSFHAPVSNMEQKYGFSKLVSYNIFEKGYSKNEVLYSDASNEINHSDEDSLSPETQSVLMQLNSTVAYNACFEQDSPKKPLRETKNLYMPSKNEYQVDSKAVADVDLIKHNITFSTDHQEVFKKIQDIDDATNLQITKAFSFEKLSFNPGQKSSTNSGFAYKQNMQGTNMVKSFDSQMLSCFPQSRLSENGFATNMFNYKESSSQNYSETCDKRWLLYWGDRQNFIAHTWQKDFVSNAKFKDTAQPSYDSEIIRALSQEIKEDGEELLKGLYSIPSINDSGEAFDQKIFSLGQDPQENCLNSPIRNSVILQENKSLFLYEACCSKDCMVDQNASNIPMPLVGSSFTLDNLKVPETHCNSDYPNCPVSLENNPFLAANYSDFNLLSNICKNTNSLKDYYMEGGGWSLASENFPEYFCDNPYETSCSLSELDLETTENECYEFDTKIRLRCSSECDENIVKQNENKHVQAHLFKCSKQKLMNRNRPCSFFLQGNCNRNDCKYSHDLSSTTCRFWKEGSCFKGSTCPFLHGYIKEQTDDSFESEPYLQHSASLDQSYSLESEADFPCLSSPTPKISKVQSGEICSIQAE